MVSLHILVLIWTAIFIWKYWLKMQHATYLLYDNQTLIILQKGLMLASKAHLRWVHRKALRRILLSIQQVKAPFIRMQHQRHIAAQLPMSTKWRRQWNRQVGAITASKSLHRSHTPNINHLQECRVAPKSRVRSPRQRMQVVLEAHWDLTHPLAHLLI